MMRRWRSLELNNIPIRYKLIINFMLISIVPSLLLGLLVSYSVTRIIENKANEHTLQLIEKVNTSIEHVVSNMQNLTYFISFDPHVQQFLSERDHELDSEEQYKVSRFLQGFTTLYPEVAGILVANHDGAYMSNDMYARTTRPLTEEQWYREAVASRGIFTIVGHPVDRNVTTHTNYKPDEVVSVARAILEPATQRVRGVVLVDLKRRVIAEAAKDVRLGKTGYLMVIEQNGKSIYTPSNPIIDYFPLEWIEGQSAGMFSQVVDGRSLQFIYMTSPFTNWTTVGVFPTNESTAEVREIQFYVVSFVFLICMMGITASLYVSHTISRPIQQLQTFMHKAESGDLTVRHISSRTDEIGMLGKSFNKMLVQLRKLLELTELQERQKREAELKSLQAHIKPHFLYNTLDTIHWLARKKGADDVAEVVESLSRLFRIGLSRGNEMIPLVEEMAHIHSYLKIQKTRYRDKLNYEIDIDPDTQQLVVLKIMLQPIVENAIYHGLKQRRGPGWVRISSRLADQHLILEVEDDGVGMTPEQLQALQTQLAAEIGGQTGGSGYGILNVQARIKLTFGERYGVWIDSEYGKGTTVKIVHPIIDGGGRGGDTDAPQLESAHRG